MPENRISFLCLTSVLIISFILCPGFGREWKSRRTRSIDVATLAELLHDTEQHHGQYEKTHVSITGGIWYVPYLSARQNGSSPEKAAAAANRYTEENFQVPPR